MKKILGRLVHFALAFAATAGTLNAIYYQDKTLVNSIATILLISISSLGYFWEYHVQQFIAKKLPKLKWDPKADSVAFLMFIVGYTVGALAFWIVCLATHRGVF